MAILRCFTDVAQPLGGAEGASQAIDHDRRNDPSRGAPEESMKKLAISPRDLLRAGLLLVAGLALSGSAAFGSGDADADLAAAQAAAMKTFKDQVNPFISTYCIRCHGEKKKKAGIT